MSTLASRVVVKPTTAPDNSVALCCSLQLFKKKKAKKYEATVMPVPLDYLCPFVFRLDLILPAISQPILQRLQRVRCALRALMMPISLYILLPYHLSASSRFTGIFLYPKY